MSANNCASCRHKVYAAEGVRVGESYFHRPCFNCQSCKKSLTKLSCRPFKEFVYCRTCIPKTSSIQSSNGMDIRTPCVKLPKPDVSSYGQKNYSNSSAPVKAYFHVVCKKA